MALKINLGEEIDVFESGSLIQFKDEPIMFRLKGDIDLVEVTVELRLSYTGGKDSKPSMEFENGGENHLIIELFDFIDIINHGNIEPIIIGSLDNRELYFSYRITAAAKDFANTIIYTFYLGKEIYNG